MASMTQQSVFWVLLLANAAPACAAPAAVKAWQQPLLQDLLPPEMAQDPCTPSNTVSALRLHLNFAFVHQCH